MTCFLQNVSVECNDPRNYRTMWGIVYSCLLTVFACIWTAVHPNLPRTDDDASVFKSRVLLMVLSLVSPEWTLARAWAEFVISRKTSEKCEMVEGWTLTHSYFVAMNGFFDPSKGSSVDPNELQQYPEIIENTGNTRWAAITKEEILDKSKGDSFSKFIIILQLLWFITQYVGRWASHLHTSQLETMTLAYAALCLLLYVLWWHKPVNVQLPIYVTRKSRSIPPTFETNVDQPPPKTETVADPMSLVHVSGLKAMEAFIMSGTIIWRVSAISITVAPAFLILIAWVVDDIAGIGALTVLVYISARIILLVLTFSSFRSPPPDLYQTHL
ncbi:uncharacterized protein EI90DRAFT_3067085, partial [Cantharellus anzutake]|uniref:uncharacterized protein n=1 Tax=Cantharellus anzutake TaxID=1750568 RepID=UPI00190310A7